MPYRERDRRDFAAYRFLREAPADLGILAVGVPTTAVVLPANGALAVHAENPIPDGLLSVLVNGREYPVPALSNAWDWHHFGWCERARRVQLLQNSAGDPGTVRLGIRGPTNPYEGGYDTFAGTKTTTELDFRTLLPAGWSVEATEGAWAQGADGLLSLAGVAAAAHEYRGGQPVGAITEDAGEQLVADPRDLTTANWVVSGTVGRAPIDGADGLPGTATRLNFGVGPTAIYQTITDAARDRACFAYVRRPAGTPPASIYMHGGDLSEEVGSWLPEGVWTRVPRSDGTGADPFVAFQNNAGEASVLDVDFVNLQVGQADTSPMDGASRGARRLFTDALAAQGLGTIDGVLTVVCRTPKPDIGSTQRIVEMWSADQNERVQLSFSAGGGIQVDVVLGGVTVSSIVTAGPIVADMQQAVLQLELTASGHSLRVNGSSKVLGAGSGAVAGLLNARLGANRNNFAAGNVFVEQINYRPGATMEDWLQ